MDFEGYKEIVDAFHGTNIVAKVQPELADGETSEFAAVTIENPHFKTAADVLNVLSAVGLMHVEGPRDTGGAHGPQLELTPASSATSLTFKDRNYRRH